MLSQRGRDRYTQANLEAIKNSYQEARSDINRARDRVQELAKLGRQVPNIQNAISKSHISGTLERSTRGYSPQQLCDFASDLLEKLFQLEQEIVCNNERALWEKDLRLIFVYEATLLIERARMLDEAELNATYSELMLVRKDAVTHYNLGREGLNACLCDVLCYEQEDEKRRERTEQIFDAGGFSSYTTANTRARNLIAAERFAALARSMPDRAVAKTSRKSKKSKKKKRKSKRKQGCLC